MKEDSVAKQGTNTKPIRSKFILGTNANANATKDQKPRTLRQLLPDSTNQKKVSGNNDQISASNRSNSIYSSGKKMKARSVLPDLKSKQRLQPSQTKVLGCQPVTAVPENPAIAAAAGMANLVVDV